MFVQGGRPGLRPRRGAGHSRVSGLRRKRDVQESGQREGQRPRRTSLHLHERQAQAPARQRRSLARLRRSHARGPAGRTAPGARHAAPHFSQLPAQRSEHGARRAVDLRAQGRGAARRARLEELRRIQGRRPAPRPLVRRHRGIDWFGRHGSVSHRCRCRCRCRCR